MLLATVAVARLLGKAAYGELGIIQSTVGMFGTFAGFGLGITATKHVAEYRESDPARAGRILGISALVACISGGAMAAGLLVFAPWLAEHTINAPHLVAPLRIGAVILFLSALNGAQTGALSGFEAFRRIARVNALTGVLSFPVIIAGAVLGGLNGTVWALAANLALVWTFNHLALRKEAARFGVPLAIKGCHQEWPVLWRFSLPAVLGGTLVGPVNWACAALLVNQPGGYGDMGLFNAANQWRTAILFVPAVLAQVVLPLLSNMSETSASSHFRRILRTNIILNASLALAVVLPLLVLAPYIMKAYGSEYAEGTNVLRVLALSAVLVAANEVVGSAIASRGKMWVGFGFNAMWAAVLLLTTALLLRLGYGAMGLAAASLIAYVLHTGWQTLYIRAVLRATRAQRAAVSGSEVAPPEGDPFAAPGTGVLQA